MDEAAEDLVTEGAILNKALLAPANGSIHSALSELLRRDAKDGRRLRPRAVRAALRGRRGAARRRPDDLLQRAGSTGSTSRAETASGCGSSTTRRASAVEGGRAVPRRPRAAARDLQPRGGQALREGASVSEAIYYFATPDGRYKQMACPAHGRGGRDPRPRPEDPRRHGARRRLRAASPTPATSATSRPSAAAAREAQRRAQEGRPPPRRLPEAAGRSHDARPPPRRPGRPRPRDDRLRHDLPPRGGRGHGEDDRPRPPHPRPPAGGPRAHRPHRGDHVHRQGGGGAEAAPARRHREGARVGDGARRRSASPARRRTTSSGRPSPRSTPSPSASCASGPSRPASTPASRWRRRWPRTAPSTTPGTPGSRSG